MLALSIKQPYLELILRGVKRAELRSRSTRIVGERFYLYASKSGAKAGKSRTSGQLKTSSAGYVVGESVGGVIDGRAQVWSRDLSVACPPAWMVELAEQLRVLKPGEVLPTGLIVGTAVIREVVPPRDDQDYFRWELSEVERLSTPLKPERQPQPVWWRPF
jgi:hypothetical protein